MSKLERLDKIIFTNQDIDKIYDWAVTNKIEGPQIYPFFEEAILETAVRRKSNGPDIKIYIYFKMLSNIEDSYLTFYFEIYDSKRNKNLSFVTDFNIEKGRVTDSTRDIKVHKETDFYMDDANVNFFIEFATKCYGALMTYIGLNKNEKESLQSKKVPILNKSKNSKKKSKKKTNRTLSRTVYTLKVTDEEIEEATRNYKRIKEAWGVRGHWREYKSGKRVWIRPYVKGDNEKKESSVYRL